MQRIERYGVIALVFLLVTIVAVSMWGERKNADGILSFAGPDHDIAAVVGQGHRTLTVIHIAAGLLPAGFRVVIHTKFVHGSE